MSSPLPLARCQPLLNAWARERFGLDEPLGGRWRCAGSEARLNGRARRVFDSDAWAFSALLTEGARPQAELWGAQLTEAEREAALRARWLIAPPCPPIVQAVLLSQEERALDLLGSGQPSPMDLSRALLAACQNGSLSLVERLARIAPLETPESAFPFSPSSENQDGDTPLMFAIKNELLPLARLLLDAGARALGPGPLWMEPATQASLTGDAQMMALVFEACARESLSPDSRAGRYRRLQERVSGLSNLGSPLAPELFALAMELAQAREESEQLNLALSAGAARARSKRAL